MRKQKKSNFFFSLILIVTIGSFVGCKESDDSEESDQTSVDPTSTAGGGSTSSSTTMSTDATAANLETAEENMIPGSLAISTSLRLADNENPCEGTDGLFDCQPNLLKLYLNMAKNSVTMTREIVTQVGQLLSHLSAGASGFVEVDDPSAEVTRIDYKITSAKLYELLIQTPTGVFLYLSVDETKAEKVYDIKVDTENSPGGEKSNGAIGQIHLLYTDEDHLRVESTMTAMDCDADDVRAPGSFVIKVNKENGVWQGKAMMYSPRWLWYEAINGTMTCESEPTSTSKMNFFTDFVGDNTNTTASLYMMPSSIAETTQFSSYTASSFCTNYPSWCVSGRGFGDTNPISSYSNPFCVDGVSSETAWGGACSSSSTLISTPTYSDETDWIVPLDLQDLTVTLPTKLE